MHNLHFKWNTNKTGGGKHWKVMSWLQDIQSIKNLFLNINPSEKQGNIHTLKQGSTQHGIHVGTGTV